MNSDDAAGATDLLLIRERAVSARERALLDREVYVSRRELGLQTRESASANLEHHNVELLGANEKLVIATITAGELREQALTTQRLQDEFLAMLSHELRNPLAPIRLAVQMMAKGNDKQGSARLLDIISRQVSHMIRLLDDLLDASRIAQGKITLHLRVVSIQDCMATAIEACEEMFVAKRQQFLTDVPVKPVYVNGDPVRLGQVFTNLLHNASKYTQEEGVIQLSVALRPQVVEIRVRDNGPGIVAATLPHIFEIFVQDERTLSRSEGGLGIGLTVAQRMVQLHGGTIEAISEGRGTGSEFFVTLPTAQAPQVAAQPTPDTSARNRAAVRILLIEDNVVTAQLLAELLGLSGHQVELAFDGSSGIEIFDHSEPHVVLCDIGLPGMDGYKIAEYMSTAQRRHRPVLIALSGYGTPEDISRAMHSGFDRHMVKPVDLELLLNVIETSTQPLQ